MEFAVLVRRCRATRPTVIAAPRPSSSGAHGVLEGVSLPFRRAATVPAPDADVLVARWRALGAARLDLPAALWDVPPCRGVAEAIVADRDVLPAVRRLVGHRARAGFTFEEVVADLDLLGSLHPAAGVIDRLEIGLAVHDAYHRAEPGWWEDGLTGLPCTPYLALRLRECRRATEHLGVPLSHAYGLLVVRLPAASSVTEASLHAVLAAEAVRRRFGAGETIVVLSARVLAVLTGRAGLPGTVEGLPAGTETWVEGLPDTEDGLDELIDELERL